MKKVTKQVTQQSTKQWWIAGLLVVLSTLSLSRSAFADEGFYCGGRSAQYGGYFDSDHRNQGQWNTIHLNRGDLRQFSIRGGHLQTKVRQVLGYDRNSGRWIDYTESITGGGNRDVYPGQELLSPCIFPEQYISEIRIFTSGAGRGRYEVVLSFRR